MIEEIVQLYNNNRNKEQAVGMEAYMKHHFLFLGIKSPIRTAIQKEWLKEQCRKKEIDWDMVQHFWELDEREYQYIAIDYLLKMKKYLKQEHIEHVEELLTTKSWWVTKLLH